MIGVRHVEAHTRKRLSGQLGPRLKARKDQNINGLILRRFPRFSLLTRTSDDSIHSIDSIGFDPWCRFPAQI